MGVYKGLDEGGRPTLRYFGPAEDAHARAQGFTPASDAEAAQATGAIDDTTGGALGAIGAGVSSALSGATLGGSDMLLRGLLSDSEMGRLAADRAAHPVLSGAANVAGAIAPAVLSGGGSLPAGLTARAGAGVSEAAGGGLLGATLGGATEGALFGAGQGVSELALSQDPLTLEHAAAVLPSSILYGAAAGGALGAGGHVVGLGLQKAKNALDDFVATRDAAKALRDNPASIASADVTTLDAAGLRKAEHAELERIESDRLPQRKQVLDDLTGYRDKMHTHDMFDVTNGVEDGEVREFGGSLKRSDRDLRNALDSKAQLAQNPDRALKILQHQEQALSDITTWGQEEMARFGHADQQLRAMREQIRAGQVEGYVPSALSERGIEAAAELEVRKAGGALPSDFQDFKKLDTIVSKFPGALDANRALQRRLTDLMATPSSERLAAIQDARDALGAPQQKSIGSMALHAAARFAGPLGAVAEHGAGAIAGLKKAAGAVATRTAKAASAFLGPASRAAGQAALATPLATKVLAAVRYGDRTDEHGQPRAEPTKLHELYKARTDEIKEQVHIAPDGSFQMRPAARAKMAAKLAGLGAVDPVGADRLESAGAARIAWLASQIPRQPDLGALQVGPDTWRPSDMEMRSLARKMAAAEDLPAVLERVVHGHVTPEDVMAMRALAPQMLQQFTTEVAAQLPTLQKTLPHERRLALSMLTGQPVDPALDPRVLRIFQGQFTDEVGTAGGTQAPKAMPQFGSIKKSPDAPTSAQNRAQGAQRV